MNHEQELEKLKGELKAATDRADKAERGLRDKETALTNVQISLDDRERRLDAEIRAHARTLNQLQEERQAHEATQCALLSSEMWVSKWTNYAAGLEVQRDRLHAQVVRLQGQLTGAALLAGFTTIVALNKPRRLRA